VLAALSNITVELQSKRNESRNDALSATTSISIELKNLNISLKPTLCLQRIPGQLRPKIARVLHSPSVNPALSISARLSQYIYLMLNPVLLHGVSVFLYPTAASHA
jgi:hypothetical protein